MSSFFFEDSSQPPFDESFQIEPHPNAFEDSDASLNPDDTFSSDFAPRTPAAAWYLNPLDASTPIDYFGSYSLFDSQGADSNLTFDDLSGSTNDYDYNPFLQSSTLQNSQDMLDSNTNELEASSSPIVAPTEETKSTGTLDNEMRIADQTIKWTKDEDKMILLYALKYGANASSWLELSQLEIFSGKSPEVIEKRHEHLLYLFETKAK